MRIWTNYVKQLQVGGPCISKFGCSESDGYFYLFSPYFVSLLLQYSRATIAYSHSFSTSGPQKTDPAAARIYGFWLQYINRPLQAHNPPFSSSSSPSPSPSPSPPSLFSLFTFIVTFFGLFIHHRCCAWHKFAFRVCEFLFFT